MTVDIIIEGSGTGDDVVVVSPVELPSIDEILCDDYEYGEEVRHGQLTRQFERQAGHSIVVGPKIGHAGGVGGHSTRPRQLPSTYG